MRRQYSSQHKNTKLEKWEWVSTLYNDKPSLQLTKLLVDTLFINFKTTGKSQIRLCSLLCAWQQRDPLSLFRDPLSLFLPGQMPWHELVPCGAATVLDLWATSWHTLSTMYVQSWKIAGLEEGFRVCGRYIPRECTIWWHSISCCLKASLSWRITVGLGGGKSRWAKVRLIAMIIKLWYITIWHTQKWGRCMDLDHWYRSS